MYYYARLQTILDALPSSTTANSAEKVELLTLCYFASQKVDVYLSSRTPRPLFLPRRENRTFSVQAHRLPVLRNMVTLPDLNLLLEPPTSITAGGSSYDVETLDPLPVRRLKLSNNRCYQYKDQDIVINGVWGVHLNYADAWEDTGDLGTLLTDTDTTLVRTGLDAGHFLRVNDEYIIVTNYDTSTNTATLLRGVNGTTAAAHSNDDTLFLFHVEPSLEYAVAREVLLMYSKRGAYNVRQTQNTGRVAYPDVMSSELYRVLDIMANL